MAPQYTRDALGPLLTSGICDRLLHARRTGIGSVQCSLDLERSVTSVRIEADCWTWGGGRYSYPTRLKERTIYYWTDRGFEPVARYASSLVKLVPTSWGAPTFEIDGIKMLPTARISPFADAEHKVDLIKPRGKVVLDTCGGLGYFAAWCLQGKARKIWSYEKNPDVMWLRSLNPWSPVSDDVLTVIRADVVETVSHMPDKCVDAVLHDPPRFGIAGELYSQAFYHQLARVMSGRGRMFHYTRTPNKISSGRDLSDEVARRLHAAGFVTERHGDGLLAVKMAHR